MTKTKKFICLGFAYFAFFMVNPQTTFAATRLEPMHLYVWAKRGNIQRLNQFRRYINLQDRNKNTALCLAQKYNDKDAYRLLLQLGASTRVSCHNDNHPVCAVIAGEKLKVSPAGWALIGAGAVAGAALLLKNDGGDKDGQCGIGYTKGLRDCSNKEHPESWQYISSGEVDGEPCGKCIEATCPANYVTEISGCGTSASNGWKLIPSQYYAGDKPCYSCEKTACDINSSTTHCRDDYTLTTLVEETKTGYNGDDECYSCSYSCDSTKGTYSSQSTCELENQGYNCDNTVSENNLTCYVPGTIKQCPEGSAPSDQALNLCGKTAGNGWKLSETTNGSSSGDEPCYICEKKPCEEGYGTTPCTDGTYTRVTSETQNGYFGDDACYQCSYGCDLNKGAYSSRALCEANNSSCTPINENGKTCYISSANAALSPEHATILNIDNIEKTSSGSENIYGIKSADDVENTTDEDLDLTGSINIKHNSSGLAAGIYAESDNTIANRKNAKISIENNAEGKAIGLYASRGSTAINEGEITITGDSGTSIGIYGEGNNTIINQESGIIDVSGQESYGIYVKDGAGSYIENAGIIKAQGENAHGIYIDTNSADSTIVNTGKIYLNGTELGDSGIELNGASLRNASTISFNGAADFNQLNGRIYLEDGGVYEAESLSGDLIVGTSNVINSREDVIVRTDALLTSNVELLTLHSESGLYTVEVASLTPSAASVIITRQPFAAVAPNDSMADYLEDNWYASRLDPMYTRIVAASSERLPSQVASELGYDVLPNFADENYIALKSLNRNIADSILEPTDERNRVIAGADSINLKTKNRGVLSGYELNSTSMYTYGDTRLDNQNRLGLGLSITRLSSNYETSGDRKLNIFNIFMPYQHMFNTQLRLATILNIGYGTGEYDRGFNRESDITDIFYGLTNELRYTINLNGFAELEPALMLNALGYSEDGFDEGDAEGALHTKKTNNLSVETGLGLFLKKKVHLARYGRLGFKIGGAYYRELNDQYDDIIAHHNGALGHYKINDYADIYGKDRAILEASVDYEYKRFSVYAKYNQTLMKRNKPKLWDIGLKYAF